MEVDWLGKQMQASCFCMNWLPEFLCEMPVLHIILFDIMLQSFSRTLNFELHNI